LTQFTSCAARRVPDQKKFSFFPISARPVSD
jgi:hypothetical protein